MDAVGGRGRSPLDREGLMTTLQQRLDRGDVLILDGAMGTELQRR